MKLVNQINQSINNWFTQPEANARENIGLFRIIYSVFYLWHLSHHFATRLGVLPEDYYRFLWLVEWIPKPISYKIYGGLEFILVTALVLLMIGFHVRLATGIILIFGCLLEGIYSSIDHELATVFLVFYIPLFMLMDCRWGDSYSLDNILKERQNKAIVNVSSTNWEYTLPKRSILVILSVLFFSSAIYKIIGTWLSFPELIANLVLERNLRGAIYGLPLNPLAPFIAQNPLVYNSLRYLTIVFEAIFCVALFPGRIRYLIFSIALIFHAINALWLYVTFTPILIVYALFIDWQELRKRLLPNQLILCSKIPSTWLKGIALGLAVIVGILWNGNNVVRNLINLGGWLDWRTLWYPILPLSLLWFGITTFNLTRSSIKWIRKHKKTL